MILLGLNGLFEKLENSLIHLKDLLKEHSSNCEMNLKDLVSQRLLLIFSLFQSCSQWADAFHASESLTQQDLIMDRFERMASQWIGQFLHGATSFCLTQLCCQLAHITDESITSLDPVSLKNMPFILLVYQ